MSGHGCRAQLWSILGAFALLYMCGGIFLTTGASSVNITEADKRRAAATLAAQGVEFDEEMYMAGAGIAKAGILGLGVPFFLCSGLPFVFIFGLLANSNRRAIREEKRHQQQLEVQRQQFAAMQQAATAQAVQAQVQFANLQQQQPRPSNPALPTPTDIRPQLEAAKALIDAKQYDAAKNLLRTIEHNKARDWLAKLEQMTKQ
jgi:hypothetical protein